VDRVLGQMLQKAVWERLDMLDELASSADNGSLLSAMRSELPRLTHGWRALLATHTPGPRGRCPECSRRWQVRMAPCSVWQAAHERLVSPDSAASATSGAVCSGDTPAVLSRSSGSRRLSAVLQMSPQRSLFRSGAVAAR
jgi:hypothetical protein